MRSTFDLIQSCERFQKRGHGFAEEGTSKKKLATSPSPSSMADTQVCSCLLDVDRGAFQIQFNCFTYTCFYLLSSQPKYFFLYVVLVHTFSQTCVSKSLKK